MKETKHSKTGSQAVHTSVLGGAFDPPHLGHLAMALGALRSGFSGEVWILPSPDRPDKTMRRPFADRLELVKTLLGESQAPERGLISASSLENDLGFFRGSLHLVRTLEERFPERSFGFLMGADTLDKVLTWNDPGTGKMTGQDFLESVPICIFGRDGTVAQELFESYHRRFAIHPKTRLESDLDTIVQSLGLTVQHGDKSLRLSEISSTRIREELSKDTPEWNFLLAALGASLLKSLDTRFEPRSEE